MSVAGLQWLLPKEIFMKPLGLLTLKVKSPSHFFTNPGSNLPWSIQEVTEDRGEEEGCNCINLGEGSGRRDFPGDTNNIHRPTSIKFLNQSIQQSDKVMSEKKLIYCLWSNKLNI